MRISFVFLSAIFGFLVLSCTKDLEQDIDDLTPSETTQKWISAAIKSTVFPTDIDSGTLRVYSDGTIYYNVARDSVLTIEANDIFVGPTISLGQSTNDFTSVRLNNWSIFGSASLISLMNNSTLNGTVLYDSILANVGEPYLIPGSTDNYTGSAVYNFNNPQNFTTSEVESGQMQLTVANGTVLNLSNVTAEIIDLGSNMPVGQFTYPSIPSNGEVTAFLDLAGITLGATYGVQFLDFGVNASTNADTVVLGDGMVMTLSLVDVEMRNGAAAAESPAQVLSTYVEFRNITASIPEELTAIELLNGQMEINIVHQGFTNFYTGVLTVRNSQDASGTALTFDNLFFAVGGGTRTVNADLSNVLISLDDNPDIDFNHLTFDLALNAPVGQVNHSAAASVQISMSMVSMEYGLISGNFGQKVINLPPAGFQMDEKVSNNLTGNYQLQNARYALKNFSDIGIGYSVSPLIFSRDVNDVPSALTVSQQEFLAGTNNPFTYELSVGNGYDKNNSSVDPWINTNPDSVFMGGTFLTNANNPNANNFLTPDAKSIIGVDVEVPLDFWGDTLRFFDTVRIEDALSDLNTLEEDAGITLEKAILYLSAQNHYPMDIALDLILVDSVAADSLVQTDIISFPEVLRAAPVDFNGNVTGTTDYNTQFELSAENVDNLKVSDMFVFKVRLVTSQDSPNPSAPFVKVKETDYITIRTAVEVHNSINL